MMPNARIEWMRQTTLTAARLPEPPFLQKYQGGQSADVDRLCAESSSDAALAKLAHAGVNLIFVRFFAGFGIEFEKAEMEQARTLISRAHGRGLKVAAAVTLGWLNPETLLLEESDARNWLQVDPEGATILCAAPERGFYARPCYNCEGVQRYMERVCGLAADAGADVLFFEGLGYNGEPHTCRCPLCVAAFREFLRQQYGTQDDRTRAAGKARFGHNNFTHVRPPAGDISGELDAPHQQEWQKFKVHTVTQYLARLRAAVVKRHPACALGADCLEDFGGNIGGGNGVDFAGLLPVVDLVTAAAAPNPGLDAFAVKTAHACGTAVLLTTHPAPSQAAPLPTLSPEGRGGTTAFGALLWNADGVVIPAELFQEGAWPTLLALKRQHVPAQTRPLAQVAVLRDTPSLAFSNADLIAQSGLESLLIKHNIPFDVLYERQIGEVSRYRCVILPGCECVSDDEVQVLEAFVAAGGGLLALEGAGARDPWRRVRPANALRPLVGPDFPQRVFREAGPGRVVYMPELSTNFDELEAALRFAAGIEAPFTVRAEAGQVLATAAQTPDGALSVQVLNTAEHPAHGVNVSLACAQTPKEITALAAGQEPQPIEFTWEHGRAQFRVAAVERYGLFSVKF
jgi:hypothetical protein